MVEGSSVLYKSVVVAGYALSSIGIMFVNKVILTSNKFPSPIFLAASQMFMTFAVLLAFSICGLIIPFSCIYAIDVTMGLAGTGAISLPLFSALRRISNFFILKRHSILTHAALVTMVLGIGDINFDLKGYTFVFINNFSTAAKGLLTKSRLSKYNYSSVTLLFYNSLFMYPFLAVLTIATGKLQPVLEFPLWDDALFVAGFLFSCLAAVTLQFLTFECTRLTSALTTSVVGVMKVRSFP
ncbi:unnamed protein product [Mesocestoides corti]|uniref:Sugar phosphate transporter domain-containing protein n=1 Tax=Mesocestoides corti TaxID=53468 RepID=A0A0R3UQ30_MESCO|nr:unnamed protein product [Mesocestoides corti]